MMAQPCITLYTADRRMFLAAGNFVAWLNRGIFQNTVSLADERRGLRWLTQAKTEKCCVPAHSLHVDLLFAGPETLIPIALGR